MALLPHFWGYFVQWGIGACILNEPPIIKRPVTIADVEWSQMCEVIFRIYGSPWCERVLRVYSWHLLFSYTLLWLHWLKHTSLRTCKSVEWIIEAGPQLKTAVIAS